MRRLSVTEYLIAENQRQSTVTAYTRLGDAINAAQEQIGAAVEVMSLTYGQVQSIIGQLAEGAPAPRDGYAPYAGYGVGAGDMYERFVFAWTDTGAKDILYTITNVLND